MDGFGEVARLAKRARCRVDARRGRREPDIGIAGKRQGLTQGQSLRRCVRGEARNGKHERQYMRHADEPRSRALANVKYHAVFLESVDAVAQRATADQTILSRFSLGGRSRRHAGASG